MYSFLINEASGESLDNASLQVLLLNRLKPFIIGTSYRFCPFGSGGRRPAFCAIRSTRFLIDAIEDLLGNDPSFLKIGSFGLGSRSTSLAHSNL